MQKTLRMLTLWALIILTLLAGSAQAVPITAGTSQRQASGSAYSDNVVPYGKSPTTGMDWTGEYKPIMVQISNVTQARPQWNLSEADVVYESVILGPHYTRYSAIFSDNYPSFVGSIRSARLHHVQLREEWDCPFVFWGGQKLLGTSITDFMREQKVPDTFQFDGTGGRGYTTDGTLSRTTTGEYARVAPHNAIANLQQLVQNHYPADYTPRNHAFQFTETPAMGFDSAIGVNINYGPDYNPSFTYNEAQRVYERYYNGQPQIDGYSKKPIVASNVIVQRTKHSYYGGIASRPVIETIGEGAADFFIGGRHIKGRWLRKSFDDRTVFVDQSGVEIQLLPGKTFIQIIPNTLDYTYTRADGSQITASFDDSKLTEMETMELIDTDASELDQMED